MSWFNPFPETLQHVGTACLEVDLSFKHPVLFIPNLRQPPGVNAVPPAGRMTYRLLGKEGGNVRVQGLSDII